MYLWFTIFFYLMIPMNVLSQCVDEVFDENNFYGFVSSKTDYDFVRGTIQRLSPECQPIQAWILMRHGTRYAGPEEVPKFLVLQKFQKMIIKNHKSKRGCLRSEKLEQLKKWKPDKHLNPSHVSAVTPLGKQEAENFGARFKSVFPEFVVSQNQINSNSYNFKTTNHQRTIETLKAFAKGYFDGNNVLEPQCSPEVDSIIEPHKQCPAWSARIANHNDERNRFITSPIFERFAIDLTVRLGFNGMLTFDQIYLMYSMCRYEYAWNKKPSVWCMIFTRQEMKILEFSEDLSYYYSCGPTCELAGQLGCYALGDMFRHFGQFEMTIPRNYPKIILYGGHTISINLLMMALKTHGAQNPLKATHYDPTCNREFRTSLQSPFLANIVAVFHKCQGYGSPNKVAFYQNERPLHLSYCGGFVCDWNNLKRKFQGDIQRCNPQC